MVDLRWLDLPLEDIRVILSDPASNEAASS
jgi:hypothetical protein